MYCEALNLKLKFHIIYNSKAAHDNQSQFRDSDHANISHLLQKQTDIFSGKNGRNIKINNETRMCECGGADQAHVDFTGANFLQ